MYRRRDLEVGGGHARAGGGDKLPSLIAGAALASIDAQRKISFCKAQSLAAGLLQKLIGGRALRAAQRLLLSRYQGISSAPLYSGLDD